MAVVKKNTEPAAPSNIREFLAKKLKEQTYTKDAKLYAESASDMFAQLVEKGEDINKIVSFDPITDTYSINTAEIKDPSLRNKNWTGSKGRGKANVIGVHTARDIKGEKGSGKKKYMGLAASWLSEWMQGQGSKSPGVASAATSASTYGLSPFKKYLKEQEFGGQNLILSDLLGEDKSEQARKAKVIDLSKKYLTQYVEQSQKETEKGNIYPHLEKAKEVLQYLQTPNLDFEELRKRALPLGWNLAGELGTFEEEQAAQEEVARTTEEAQVKKAEEEKAAFYNALREKGIPESQIDDWYTKGITRVTSELPTGLQQYAELKPWYQGEGLFTLSDTEGKNEFMISPITGLINEYKFKLNSPLYGSYLGKDVFGKLTYYKPGIRGYSDELFKGTGGEGLRPISGQVDGNNNYQIYGVPEKAGTGYDYLTHLILRDESGNEIHVQKNPTTGEYHEFGKEDGQPLKINLFDYKAEDLQRKPYFSVMKNIQQDTFNKIQPSNELLSSDALQQEYDEVMKEGLRDNTQTAEKLTKLVADLKKKIQSPGNYVDKFVASELYDSLLVDPKVVEFLNRKQKSMLEKSPLRVLKESFLKNLRTELDYWNPKENSSRAKVVGLLKTGGIVKHQLGGRPTKTLTEEEYLSRVTPGKKPTSAESGIKDWRGTLKDMSTLEKISLAGSVASIAPGVGAIGGAVTTLADLGRMATGEDVGWGTIAADLGFTALALVGGGALRGVSAAGKAAKFAKGIKEGEAAIKTFGEAGKTAAEAAKISAEIAEATGKAGKFASLGKEGESALDIIKRTGSIVEKVKKVSSSEKSVGSIAGVFDKEEISLLKGLGVIEPKTSITKIMPTKFRKSLAENVVNKVSGIEKTPLADIQKVLEKTVPVVKEVAKPATVAASLTKPLLGPKTLKAIGTAGTITVGAMGIPSAINVVKTAATEGIGAVNTDDLKTAMFTVSGAAGILKNKQLLGMVKKVEGQMAKTGSTVKIGEHTIPISKRIKLEDLKKGKTVFGKEIFKDRTTKANEKTFANISEKLRGSNEALPKDLIKSKEDLESLRKQLGNIEWTKATQAESGLSTGAYKRVSRLLEGQNASYWLPNWKPNLKGFKLLQFKDGGIVKAQSGTFLKPLTKPLIAPSLTEGIKSMINPNEWKTKVLKATNTGAPLKSLVPINTKMPTFSEGLANIIKSQTNWRSASKLLGPTLLGPTLDQLKSTEIPRVDEIKNYDTSKGKLNLGNIIKGINPLDVINVSRLALGLSANKQIISDYLKANEASYFATPLPEKTNLRVGSYLNPMFEREASNIRRTGRRIAGSTSDLNKGIIARLQAEDLASQNVIKGDLATQDYLNKLRGAQQELDLRTAEGRRAAMAENLAKRAQVDNRRWTIMGEGESAAQTMKDQFLAFLGENIKMKQLEKKQDAGAKSYYDYFLNSPYSAEYQDYNKKFSQQGALERKKAFEDAQTGTTTISWEASGDYQKWLQEKRMAEERLSQLQKEHEQALLAYKIGLPRMKRGGSLSLPERIALEDEKAINARRLEGQKQLNRLQLEMVRATYKSVLENQKRMREGLRKLFK